MSTTPSSEPSWQMPAPAPVGNLAPPRKSGVPPWAWVLIGCGGMGCLTVPIVAAILFPVFAAAREKARESVCMSHVKQLGLAMLMYSQDYDNHLPNGAKWMDQTSAYTGVGASAAADNPSSIYRCPSYRVSPYGYAYNSALSKKNSEKIKSPESTPAIYDSTAGTPNATDAMTSLPAPGRHRKGNVVGFVDGHVRYLKDGATDLGSGN